MSYEYSAFVRYNDPDDPLRLKNLSETPTVTAYEGGDGDNIAGASIANITTGIYKVKVTHTALEPVLFKVIPHNDDKDDFPDEALLAEEVRFVLDTTAADNKSIAAIKEVLVNPNAYIVSTAGVEWCNGIYERTGDYAYMKNDPNAFVVMERVGGVWKIYNPGPSGADIVPYTATNDAETPDKVDNWELGASGELPLPNVSSTSAIRLASEQGEITWGQQKILADKAGEGALHIVNENEDGAGQYNSGAVGQLNEGDTPVEGYDPALALEATLTAIKGAGWTNETLKAIKDAAGGGGLDAAGVRSAVGLASANLDTQLGNIKTDTGNIKTDTNNVVNRLTAARAGYLDKLNVSGTLANTNNANSFKADVTGLAKTTDLSGLAEKTDIPNDYAKASALATVDGKVDAIKLQTDKIPNTPAVTGEYTSALTAIQADLDNPGQYKADISGLAKTTDLSGLAEKTDIPSDYAKANDLNGLAKTTDITALNNLSAAEMLNEVVVGTFTLREILTILAAKSDGYPATGGGTTTITYGGIDGTPGVIVETVDEDGNRSKVEFNL